MARSAVLAGRTTADLVRNVFVVDRSSRSSASPSASASGPTSALFLCGVLMILFFAYALCWGFAIVGLSAPNAETAQVMVFPILFPLHLRLVGLRAGGRPCRVGCRPSPSTSR